MTLLYALTAFLSAALIFLVQPMAAKMALPVLGGSASVWTTSMLFFQMGLLAGYGWAHVLDSRFSRRIQVAAHLALLAAAALALPPALARGGLPPIQGSPAPWLLLALGAGFGLPYVALAATGPLVQAWFSSTGHRRSADPYFLYAASNAGSFLGLLAYPFLVEPHLPVRALGTAASTAGGLTQATAWSAAYGASALLIAGCGGFVLLRGRGPGEKAPGPQAPSPSWRAHASWAFLAFVPSSATLGTTQYLTTDLAAVPLLWIVPLGIYLLTFVIAFAPGARLPLPSFRIAFGVLAVATAASFHEGIRRLGLPMLGLPLATLAALGLLAHGRLAASRPDRAHLTRYFLAIAAGGVLGGAFNAIAAPALFTSIAEYPIALALAAFLSLEGAPRKTRGPGPNLLDFAAPATVLAAAIALAGVVPTSADGARWTAWLQATVPGLCALATLLRPRRFAWSLAALLSVSWITTQSPPSSLQRNRSFYGVHRVATADGPTILAADATGRQVVLGQKFHVLVDGVTRHGTQAIDPARRRVPTTYFHPSGPLGDVIRALRLRGPLEEVGIVGLGAGTIAAYGEAGERFTFFEIDPSVAVIARDPALFTYLADSRATTAIVFGDGRMSLAAAPESHFDLIVIDAFSSDAIPAHLLTQEALALYLRKLKPGGCVALHITNRYLALDPVIGAIAARLGAPAALLRDATRTPEQAFEGKDLSTWAVVGKPGASLPVEGMGGWRRFSSDPGSYSSRATWTDDRSDVVGLLLAR